MHINKVLFFAAIVLISISCDRTLNQAQETETSGTVDSLITDESVKENVKAALSKYFEARKNKDFEMMLSYTYDEIFKTTSKDSMLHDLQNPDSISEISFNYEIKDVSPIVVDRNREVVLVNFESNKIIHLADSEYDVEIMTDFLKERYDAVEYEDKLKGFHVRSEEIIYAIKREGKGQWKFITFEQSQEPANRKIIALDVYLKLMEYEE